MSAERRVPIAIFARAPRPGHVKTRLIPALGPEGAAALYRAFVLDTLASVASIGELEPIVWAASEDDAAALASGLPCPVRLQPEAELGERMRAALEDGVQRTGRALVLGTDVPTLPASILRAAVQALDRAELVLGPACDGGYYLIGARDRAPTLTRSREERVPPPAGGRGWGEVQTESTAIAGSPPPRPSAAGGIRWSSRFALADTIALAGASSVELLRPWYDVDTPDDLSVLRAHLAIRPAAAPATARALRSLARDF